MIVTITEWATDSYFDLVVKSKVISKQDYKTILRPDVSLLMNEMGLPLQNPKFNNSKFWGPAKSHNAAIPGGFKMKWHNFGNGNYQLRLCIAILNNESYICKAYVKDANSEKREMANFKIYLRALMMGNFTKRGVL